MRKLSCSKEKLKENFEKNMDSIIFSPKKLSLLLECNPVTLRRFEEKKLLKCYRTEKTDRRYYTLSQILNFLYNEE